jgi:hypothetical protein
MKFFQKAPDGGKDSGSTGYFLVEIKPLFSIVLLHFQGTREAYHSHAFNALTLWLKGRVREHLIGGGQKEWGSGQLKYTSRSSFHRVESIGDAWALSFRGPWVDTWREFRDGKFRTLTHGRRLVT